MGSGQPEGRAASKKLLIVDDEVNMRHMLSALLRKSGYRVDSAADGSDAMKMVDDTIYDFILCDLKMPNMGGMDFLKQARDKLWASTVIMMSAYGSIDLAIEAMKLGAYDFISKPFKSDEVLLALKKAEERESLKRENRWLKQRIRKIQENYNFANMVGRHPRMQAVFNLADKAARFDTTVLITGESGTGKELIAKGLHAKGHRSRRPMITINCGGIPENLLESELFGHVKGAFTGAERNKKGLFEEADGGTLFLDEIGELSFPLQVKLLRVLQENEIRAVGDSRSRTIDVRVIAATAKHLEEEVHRGTFRDDLFYRLNVFRIHMPPLREWAADIPLLSRHFINIFNEKLDTHIRGISPEAMRFLRQHRWPGNVRELENVIERALVLAEGPVLQTENFPAALMNVSVDGGMAEIFEGYSLKAARRALEKKFIVRALRATDGNRTRAGQLLEISHPSLLSKIKTYDIDM